MYFRVVPKYFLIFSSLDCPLSKHFQVLLSISRYFRVVPQYFFILSKHIQVLLSTSKYFWVFPSTSELYPSTFHSLLTRLSKHFWVLSNTSELYQVLFPSSPHLTAQAPSCSCPPLTIHPFSSHPLPMHSFIYSILFHLIHSNWDSYSHHLTFHASPRPQVQYERLDSIPLSFLPQFHPNQLHSISPA